VPAPHRPGSAQFLPRTEHRAQLGVGFAAAGVAGSARFPSGPRLSGRGDGSDDGRTLSAAPVDELWHELFGRDAVLWRPPHMVAAPACSPSLPGSTWPYAAPRGARPGHLERAPERRRRRTQRDLDPRRPPRADQAARALPPTALRHPGRAGRGRGGALPARVRPPRDGDRAQRADGGGDGQDVSASAVPSAAPRKV
jgi:hypothetical protein